MITTASRSTRFLFGPWNLFRAWRAATLEAWKTVPLASGVQVLFLGPRRGIAFLSPSGQARFLSPSKRADFQSPSRQARYIDEDRQADFQ